VSRHQQSVFLAMPRRSVENRSRQQPIRAVER
jgi:hypothetical protein